MTIFHCVADHRYVCLKSALNDKQCNIICFKWEVTTYRGKYITAGLMSRPCIKAAIGIVMYSVDSFCCYISSYRQSTNIFLSIFIYHWANLFDSTTSIYEAKWARVTDSSKPRFLCNNPETKTQTFYVARAILFFWPDDMYHVRHPATGSYLVPGTSWWWYQWDQVMTKNIVSPAHEINRPHNFIKSIIPPFMLIASYHDFKYVSLLHSRQNECSASWTVLSFSFRLYLWQREDGI